MEYWIKYEDDVSANDVLEFAHWFKTAKPEQSYVNEFGNNKISLYDYSLDILPKCLNNNIFDLFFTTKVDYKVNCKCCSR